MELRRSSRTRRKVENSQPGTPCGYSAVGGTRMSTRKRTRQDSPERSPVPKRTNNFGRCIVPKKVVDGKVIDPYCWVCHNLADDINCGKCCRVYHHSCLQKELKLNSVQFGCECIFTTVDGSKSPPWNEKDLKEILTYAVVHALGDKNIQKKTKEENKIFYQLFKIWPDFSENDYLCKIVDIDVLTDYINLPPLYKSTGQFFADVKWIYHNCYIFHGSNHYLTQQARSFIKNMKMEMLDVEACRECYHHRLSASKNFFTGVCEYPHPVVWAKVKGSPFWPAKCLRVQKGHADVRFFGTHDKSIIALDQIYRISKEQPNKTSARETSKYKDAIEELKIYEINHKAIHGSFTYYPEKTTLDKNVKLVKKSHKRGKGRNRSKSSVSNNVSGAGANELDQPSFNVSVLYDTQAETKVRAPHDLSFSSEMNDDDDPVIKYNMTCEVMNENNTDDITEGSSSSQQSPQKTALSADSMPVITSAASSSQCANNNQVRKENTASATKLPSTEESNSGHKLMEQTINHIITGNDDDDDEVQMIQETRSRTLVETVQQSAPMMKTLCELLLSNRPAIREHLSWFQNAVVKLYITMWLDAMSPRVDAEDCKAFQMIYERLLVKFGQLQAENNKLKAQISEAAGRKEQINQIVTTLKKNYDKIVEDRQMTIDNLNKVIVQLEEEIQESQKKMAKPEDHTLPNETANIACQVDFPDDSSPDVPTDESDIIQKIKSNLTNAMGTTGITSHIIEHEKVVIKQVGQHISRKVMSEPVMMPPELHNQAVYQPHLQVQEEIEIQEITVMPSTSSCTIPLSSTLGQQLSEKIINTVLEPTRKYKGRNRK